MNCPKCGSVAAQHAHKKALYLCPKCSLKFRANGFTLVELLLVMLAMFCLGTVAIIAYARALGCTP